MSTRESVFREEQRTAELRQTGRLRVIQYRLEREGQAAREALDAELRLRHAAQDIELDEHIDRLTAKLLGEEPMQPGEPQRMPV
jgi:hypothetical protein